MFLLRIWQQRLRLIEHYVVLMHSMLRWHVSITVLLLRLIVNNVNEVRQL